MIVKGNSGDTVEILDGQVIKTASSDRIYRQIDKQVDFQNYNKLIKFDTPTVISMSERKVYMRYIASSDFISYLSHCDKTHIDGLVDNIFSLVKQSHDSSSMVEVSFDVIQSKFNSVASNLDKKYYGYFDYFSRDDLYLPVGKCHGDLTFSNMLFKGDTIYLIDFLDSYLESPIQDMVKIRQDTCYKWSFLMYSNSFDNLKMSLMFDYMDSKFESIFSRYKYYCDYYKLFQFMNLLRIIPYTKDPEILEFLDKSILGIIE